MKPANRAVAFGLLLTGVLAAAAPASGADNQVAGIRFWSLGELTRVAIQTRSDAVFRADRVESPPRIFFDLQNVARQPGKRGVETLPVGDGLVKRIRIAEVAPGTTRVVLDLETAAQYSVSQLANPPRIVIEVRPAESAAAAPPVRSATGEKNLADESETAPEKPAPALDLPPAKRAATAAPAKPAPALDPSRSLRTAPAAPKPEPPLELPAAMRTPSRTERAAPAAAKPEPALELPPALRAPPAAPLKTRPAAPEPGIPTEPVKTEPALKAAPAKAEPAAPKPGTSTQPVKPEPALDLPSAATVKPEPATAARPAAPAKAEPAAPKPGTSTQPVKPEPALDLPSAATVKPEPATAAPKPAAVKPELAPALAAKADSRGGRSLIRALGLKLERIVIDPGHGGHDTGTIGSGGLQEKDLVLDIAQRLGKLIEQRMGSEVIYTRRDDTFIPLEERTRIANEHEADLFLSIHANSSRSRDIAGSETFYLNFTTSKDELEVAARENATSQTSIHELQDLLQNIVKQEKSQESREFAGSIQKALYTGLSRGRGKNRGVKKAPFLVLVRAGMPSVLAEVAFLSNPREETLLKRADYRERVAEALFKGVQQYANTLSHFRTVQGTPPKPAAPSPEPAR
jgi:N-acetylmuramoyl-L-alanine amidase